MANPMPGGPMHFGAWYLLVSAVGAVLLVAGAVIAKRALERRAQAEEDAELEALPEPAPMAAPDTTPAPEATPAGPVARVPAGPLARAPAARPATRLWKRLAVGVLAVGALLLALVLWTPRLGPVSTPLPGGPSPETPAAFPWASALLLYAAMALGMVGKTLWDAIEARQKGQRRLNVDLWALVKPLVVSPLVFMLVWQSRKTPEVDVMAFCFAFQNGFTWQTLLGRVVTAAPGAAPPHARKPVPKPKHAHGGP